MGEQAPIHCSRHTNSCWQKARGMKLNEQRRQKNDRLNSRQYPKHTKLHFDKVQAEQSKNIWTLWNLSS